MSIRPGIDLHTHTTASDGAYSPAELVDAAARLGLLALAVTDHDTLAGLPEAIAAARARGIELIAGVELSVEDAEGRIHLLGYGFEPDDMSLRQALVDIRAKRNERNERIMGLVRDLDLPITWDDVVRHAGDAGEVIARPHFAAALMERGTVSSVREAFDKYLGAGKPLYLPKDVLTPLAAIDLLHRAGGAAVLAHPGLSAWADPWLLEPRLKRLQCEAGLDGVEAYYNKHSTALTRDYLAIAGRLGLLATGGSDFHGAVKPDVCLGDVYEGGPAPAEMLPLLKAAIGAVRSRRG
jgi:predicted metal-dependent phosphoesterase TrpH